MKFRSIGGWLRGALAAARVPASVWYKMVGLIVIPTALVVGGGVSVAAKRELFDSYKLAKVSAVLTAGHIEQKILDLEEQLQSVLRSQREAEKVPVGTSIDVSMGKFRELIEADCVRLLVGASYFASGCPTDVDGRVEEFVMGESSEPKWLKLISDDTGAEHRLVLGFESIMGGQTPRVEVEIGIGMEWLGEALGGEIESALGVFVVRRSQDRWQVASVRGSTEAAGLIGGWATEHLVAGEDLGLRKGGWKDGGHLYAAARVPGLEAWIVASQRGSLADTPVTFVGVITLGAILIIAVLVAGRIAGTQLGMVEVVRSRADKLIMEIEPDWKTSVSTVSDLVEIFERLDEVVHEEKVKATEEAGRRTEAMEALQSKLIEAGQLAVVGEVAQGVMHEIGQPLSVLSLIVEELEEDADKNGAHIDRASLKRVRSAVDRITRIQEGIRERARRDSWEQEVLDLAGVVDETCELHRVQAKGAGVRLTEVSEGDGFWVRGSQTELSQCLSNLVINGIEALKESDIAGGGMIEVRLSKSDTHVSLVVEDDGPGMSQEAIDQAFEIGFTSKKTGSGFGLNMCKRLVELHHHGSIEIESEREKFTRVRISLPLHRVLEPS